MPLDVNSIKTFFTAIPFSYMALFPVLNPLGGAFIILAMTVNTPEPLYLQLCKKIAINTFILLFIVLSAGTYILEFFGINIPIVQVGGGLVVAYIGWCLLNQTPDTTSGSTTSATTEHSKDIMNLAFYPLTMPITAGPGCMAVTLTISAHETARHSFHSTLLGEAGVIVGLILSALTVYFCYRYAENIKQRLGENGTHVIVRLSAFINFCIGLQITWHGITALIANMNGS
ncbi:MAG: putative antibiotic resistance protein [Gammaproteobacteria bacterium]|jgi:multiple antibiotic resistance protein|nr:putative antibiotic resistance protein [Gammaproteobacteria bacterium]